MIDPGPEPLLIAPPGTPCNEWFAAPDFPAQKAVATRIQEQCLTHTITLPNGHAISDDRARLNMEFVLASLATAYWAATRPRAVTERSWANCLCFGIYAPNGGQVGFGRLLTDYAMRAHLGDVFIHPASRGLGLGKALLETILGHPELATVAQWTLVTSDAHGLYARYGFRVAEADGRWMTLDRG